MNRIIKVYLKNVFKQKGFYICLAISFMISIIIPFIFTIVMKSYGEVKVSNEIIGTLIGGVGIIETIFITIFVCSDFSEGATKNYIARGYTRRQVLNAKFIVSIIAVLAFMLSYIVGIFILYAKNGLSFDKTIIYYIIACLASLIANVGLYVVISNTAEKLGTAIAINLILPRAVSLISPLIGLISKSKINFSNYWITGLNNLLSETPTLKETLIVVSFSIVYLVLLFEISNLIIKKKEIK